MYILFVHVKKAFVGIKRITNLEDTNRMKVPKNS